MFRITMKRFLPFLIPCLIFFAALYVFTYAGKTKLILQKEQGDGFTIYGSVPNDSSSILLKKIKKIPGIHTYSKYLSKSLEVCYGDNTSTISVKGINPDFLPNKLTLGEEYAIHSVKCVVSEEAIYQMEYGNEKEITQAEREKVNPQNWLQRKIRIRSDVGNRIYCFTICGITKDKEAVIYAPVVTINGLCQVQSALQNQPSISYTSGSSEISSQTGDDITPKTDDSINNENDVDGAEESQSGPKSSQNYGTETYAFLLSNYSKYDSVVSRLDELGLQCDDSFSEQVSKWENDKMIIRYNVWVGVLLSLLSLSIAWIILKKQNVMNPEMNYRIFGLTKVQISKMYWGMIGLAIILCMIYEGLLIFLLASSS